MPTRTKIAFIAVFWMVYLSVPLWSQWTWASSVECAYCIGEILRFSFSIAGYAFFGGVFYVLTGGSDRSDFALLERAFHATLAVTMSFVMAVLMATDWSMVSLFYF